MHKWQIYGLRLSAFASLRGCQAVLEPALLINSELLPLSRENIAHRIHVHLSPPLLQLRGLFIEPLPDGVNWLNIIAATGECSERAVRLHPYFTSTSMLLRPSPCLLTVQSKFCSVVIQLCET